MNLMLMGKLYEQFLEKPNFGVRQMTWYLRKEGHLMKKKRIRRLMWLMGRMPIYQKPNTSKAAKGKRRIPSCYEVWGWIGPARSGPPV